MANHYATALNATPSYGERFGKKLLTLTLLAIPLGFLLAGMIAYVMPRKYESRAVVQVNPSHRLAMTPSGDLLQSQMTPQFFATQFEVIRSQATLAMVAEKLNLANRWNTSVEDAIVKLSAIVHAQNIRGTDLIAINVMHTGPEDARDIVQAVYESYKERRLEAESKLTDGAIQTLEEGIIAQTAVVENERQQLQQLESKIASAGNPVAEADPSNETLRLKKHLTLLQQAKNDDERMLLAAMMLDGENPVKAIYQEYLKAGEDLDQMQKNGLADVHPNHVAQKKRIRELSEKIQSSLSKYVQELQAQVGDEAANPATEVTSNDNLVLRTQIQTLSDELATQEKMLQEMKQKFATDEINLKQPQNIIQLHEAPEIAKAPSSPRVNRMLLLGGVGLPLAVLLLGLPLTVFVHLVSRR